MKKSYAYKTFFIFITFFIIIPHSYELKGQNNTISNEQSEIIINKIYNKYVPVYKRYRGIESDRTVDIVEYNPNSNTLINRYTVSLVRKEFFHDKPEITISRYIKNDEEQRPSDFHGRDIEPLILVLDENGRKSYITTIFQCATVANQRCYKMHVKPRKKNTEHFEGFMYFRADTLDLVLMEGTCGDMPYSFREYNMKLFIEHINGLPVIKSGSYIMRIYIPVLQPDRRYVYSIKVNNNRPLLH